MNSRMTALRAAMAAVSLVAVATLGACGGGGGGDEAPAPTAPAPAPAPSVGAVASLSIAPSSIDDFWGYAIRLQVTARDAAGNAITPTPAVTLSTGDESVVRPMSATTTIDLLRPGVTTVTATIGGVSASSAVNVIGFERLARAKLNTMCALADGRQRIYCWGNAGVTGGTMITFAPQQFEYVAPTPIPQGDIPAGSRIAKVVGDQFGLCALTDDGEVFCWGARNGGTGSLGIGVAENRSAPTRIAAGDKPTGVRYVDLSVDANGGCAAGDDGKLYCWGYYSLIPNRNVVTNSVSHSPVASTQGSVPLDAKLIKVAVGLNSSCALADNGRAYCWTGTSELTTVDQGAVPANVKLVEIQMGEVPCALGDDGKIYCWGSGSGRLFGDGTAAFVSNRTPTAVADGAKAAGVRFTSFSAGGSATSSCGTAEDGFTYCWGRGYRGSLGDGDTNEHDALVPVRVMSGEKDAAYRFTQINCSQYTCTGLASDRRIYSWGSNDDLMLSRSNQITQSATPLMVTRPTRP
jgi:hypothetical protein